LAYDAAGNQSAQSAAVSATTLTPWTVSNILSDDFHATALSSLWSFINPKSDASVRLNGTQAIITVPGGTEHDVWTSGNFAPRIMQAASNGDFEVEVKFDSLVAAAYQMEGIIAEQNGSNFVRFDVYHDGSTPRVFAATFTGGQPTVQVDNPVSLGSGSVWLRLKRTGTSWTGSISLDGTTFNVAAQFTQTLTLANIGPFAGNCCGSTAPAFTAAIDYFFNTASPISPEDGGGPAITNVSAVPAAGGATITWTTDRAATTQVKYGLTTSYGSSTPMDSSMVTSHSVVLSGMACATTYHYVVTSTNAAGANPSSSPDATFVTSACPAAPSPVSDNFNNTALNTGLWSFVNPVGDATVRLNGKQAVIAIPAGKSHDAWTPSNLSARLMQTAPDTDFEVEMKLDSVVAAQYQMQGILIEQDSANYLRFDVYYDGWSAHLFAATFSGGAPTVRVDNPITKGGPVWLRLKRTGSTWTGSYSFDGNTFVTGVSFTQQMKVAKAGLFAGTNGENGGPAPAFTALVDYWFNTANRLVP
jgi:regulation of enolase protein 1 (concanavalin A-like superfamily)